MPACWSEPVRARRRCAASPRRAAELAQTALVGIETPFILLFVLATTAAVVARRLRAPYTVMLVLTGLVVGGLNLFPAPPLTKGLLFSVILPGLLFEAAFNLDRSEEHTSELQSQSN